MFTRIVRAVAFALLAGLGGSLHAAPINLSILSGSNWLSTTSPGAGDAWTTAAFDDSSWISAFAPYPNSITTPNDIVPGTSAQLMWYWNKPTPPTGGSGPNEAFFRFNFNLPVTASLPLLAQAMVIADDVFEMYVNGTLVKIEDLDGNQGPGGKPIPVFIDFTSNLQVGDNVIAIRAFDGSLVGGPSNRGLEWLFFDGVIASVSVPEPSTPLLLGAALVGLAFARRKRSVQPAIAQ